MLRNLIEKNRSYRRFYEYVNLGIETLKELVDLARLSPSGGNMQPLKYILSSDPQKNVSIFPYLSWAGYLSDWPGPCAGERPSDYIIVLGDTTIKKTFGCDHGIAVQSMLLGAVEKGFGGCIIGTIQRGELRKALEIPLQYEILLVLALGKPKESVVLESIDVRGDIKYWRDETGVHHVPKRLLDDIIVA